MPMICRYQTSCDAPTYRIRTLSSELIMQKVSPSSHLRSSVKISNKASQTLICMWLKISSTNFLLISSSLHTTFGANGKQLPHKDMHVPTSYSSRQYVFPVSLLTFCRSAYLSRNSTHGMEVSPHFSASRSASYTNIYCSWKSKENKSHYNGQRAFQKNKLMQTNKCILKRSNSSFNQCLVTIIK